MFGNIVDFLSHGENIAFFICALLAIGGAIFMLSFTKVVHMVMAVALTFISLAGLYVVLEAEFVAVVQILIYAGAISILMIFGIMMTKHTKEEEEEPKRPWHNGLLFVGAAGLFGIIFYAIQQSQLPSGEYPSMQDNTMEIGKLLFSNYVIPFELMSVLLTVAFIGAIIVAKREED
ncbi:NADH-quinone oxidoreductase subunit J [Paenibacillus ehimensis]|uniref:NADH-quinone oxidoreductase subunit J n=1 Tax=Paenibacillus ehimensis TaxID=79264 RepID=A0ABT8VCZ1_9BACL|nr:NADH-quinone oxidoreductase subunit J [Paenibacillus ehimensis]MDO3678858.1 NADH-quinone oxidoreductase subunit J [Paenibacillus ehimensis]MEC0209395.1 NADH-quinone oxidoreductase subunit J [Paenibacillus ehimensis]